MIQLRYRARSRLDADSLPDYRALHDTVLTRFLPAIGARDVRPDDGYD